MVTGVGEALDHGDKPLSTAWWGDVMRSLSEATTS